MNLTKSPGAIVLILVGVVVLVASLVKQAISGELLRFSPGVAVSLGWFLGGILLVVRQKFAGRAEAQPAHDKSAAGSSTPRGA